MKNPLVGMALAMASLGQKLMGGVEMAGRALRQSPYQRHHRKATRDRGYGIADGAPVMLRLYLRSKRKEWGRGG